MPEAFSDYEGFIYLLAELELVIEGGTIGWSVATARATKLRLEEMAIRMDRIIAQIGNE